jgi:hypothetical protein
MLSATPINLHNQDLFNLLRLLDPEHFRYEQDFNYLIETNKPLVLARDALLNQQSTAAEVLKHLENAGKMRLLRDSHQLAAIMREPPTDNRLADKSYRAELADQLERMNLLSHVITRTRKRDVQELRDRQIIRNVKREAVKMSPEEQELYQIVTDATRDYAWQQNINDGFLLATPQRQVTSCPAAIAEAWLGEYGEGAELDKKKSKPLRDRLRAVLPGKASVATLRITDSKFSRFMQVAGEF